MIHKSLPLALSFGLLTASSALASNTDANIEADLEAITKQYNAAATEEARMREEIIQSRINYAVQDVTLKLQMEITQLKMDRITEALALQKEVIDLKSQLSSKEDELKSTKASLTTQIDELKEQIARMKADGKFFREHFKDHVEKAMAEDAAKEAEQQEAEILNDVKKAVNGKK